MSHTKGEWRISGLYIISRQNKEDYIRICQNLSSDADARLIAAAPDLLEACKVWEKVESEMSDNNPCPDLALRAQYRKDAVALTKVAIAKAKQS